MCGALNRWRSRLLHALGSFDGAVPPAKLTGRQSVHQPPYKTLCKKPLTLANQGLSFGAGEMNRTPDLLITNELLYRLSYTGVSLQL